jgi:hypothetical protein
MRGEVTSTNARVRDPAKVCAILDSYRVQGVEIMLAKEYPAWTLFMALENEELEMVYRPQALHRDQWLKESEGSDYEWDKRFDEQGEEGFLRLLRELAPQLDTPLLLLAVTQAKPMGDARAWSVQPGAKEVQTLTIEP